MSKTESCFLSLVQVLRAIEPSTLQTTRNYGAEVVMMKQQKSPKVQPMIIVRRAFECDDSSATTSNVRPAPCQKQELQ